MTLNLRLDAYTEFPNHLPVMPLKALLLDDSLFDRKRIERMARDTGLCLHIESVSCLSMMAKRLDGAEFNVVFLDYLLPEGSGHEAIEMLRTHAAHRNCAAIMIAGDDTYDEGAAAMREACDAYIAKDALTAERLRETVVAAINERAFASEARLDVDLPATDDDLAAELEVLIRNIRKSRNSINAANCWTDVERQAIQLWIKFRSVKDKAGSRFDLLACPKRTGHPTH